MKKTRRNMFGVSSLVFTVLAVAVSLMSIPSVSLGTTTTVVATGSDTPYMTMVYPWREFNMTKSTFGAGMIVDANVIMKGEPANPTLRPRVCIMNDLQFKQIDYNKQIDSQSFGCFYGAYDNAKQASYINFHLTFNETGRYHLIFIATTPFVGNSISLHTEQPQEFPVKTAVESSFVITAAVFGFLASRQSKRQ